MKTTLFRVAATMLISLFALPVAQAQTATSSYTYDKLNRLTSATIDGSRIEYTYDAAGNITRVLTPYSIAVTKNGTGTGVVSDDAGKVSCGSDCSGVYDLDAVVDLTATPDPGMSFTGWSGACGGSSTCTVTVDGAEAVTAGFDQVLADIGITKTDDLTSVEPGAAVTYTIVASNAGPSTAPDVIVTDTFPIELTCTWSAVSDAGVTGSAGTGSGPISETLTMAAGAAITYTASCTIDSSATGVLSNTASTSSAVTDPNPGNESATDDTTLTPSADLWLTLSPSAAAVGLSGTVTYTIDVGNLGPSDANTVQVQATVPGGATFLAADGIGWVCSEDAGTITCDRPILTPEETSQILVDAQMPAKATVAENSASITSTTPEADPGDESDTASVDVFGPPTIVEAGSVSSTEGGALLPGTSTDASFTQIYLTASHELRNPGGDSDPFDATNPDCYRLFQAAPEGTFGSTTCGDPTDIPILGVSYGSAGTHTVALMLSGGQALPGALYRLVVCASGSSHIQDNAGNALDGDGDGTAGDDFSLDFEVRVTNLLTNPNFDGVLDGWETTSEVPGDVIHDDTLDASAAPTSGAALLVNLVGAGSLLEISQCVSVLEDEPYVVGGKLQAASSGPTFPEIRALVVSYGSAGCAGVPLGGVDAGSYSGDTAGLWVEAWQTPMTTAVGAVSAQVTFQVTGDEFMAESWLDDLQFFFYDIVIFIDGFETGDSSLWSVTVGK